MRVVWVIAFTLLAGSAVLPARASRDALDSRIARFIAPAEQPLREYRALRRMHASSEKTSKYDAWLDAWTELKGGRFSYEVVSERGADVTRTKVLRAALAREQDLVNSGDGTRGDLTPDNYEFADAGRDLDGARLVQIKPRRSDVMLVDGHAVFDDRGELMRIEGRLAKNPSFWTSLVNIVRRYARIGGVRVPVAIDTIATVKFVGRTQMDVVYDYRSVNGQPIGVSGAPSTPVHSAAR